MLKRARMAFVAACMVALTLGGGMARAGAPLDLVRDAETEAFLREMARPVFEQAGLPPDAVRFVLVHNSDVNAFVAGGMNIFITTGLLEAVRTPGELVGVVAHEVGHITGGHLIRTAQAHRQASAAAILATLAGVAAAVSTREGAAGAAAVSLGQQVAQRSFLQYSRTQESSADQAALRFLQGSHISAQGMHDFLERLQDQDLLPTDQQSAFVRTHPLNRDRVESVAAALARNPFVPDSSFDARWSAPLARIKSKLSGFVDPRGTLQRLSLARGLPPETKDSPETKESFAERYGWAVALHQTGDTQGALALVTTLLGEDPQNPYLHELRGQILYESGQVSAAVPAYREAVTLAGGNDLLRVGLAQALLNDTTRSGSLSEAVMQLEQARTTERTSPLLWRLLATAYGRQNNLGMAAYALSEEALMSGNKPVAVQQAKRAQSVLPTGSPGWIRAGDVLAGAQEEP